jgi:dipeptidyl aminopeptidase/acylaminoacyl peptidase
VKPTDLHLFRALGRPSATPDGDVLVGLSTPDLAEDRYRGVLWLARPGVDPVAFTHGPRDSAPVVSPDGETVVFLRAGESGPPQLYAMPRGGGEPRRLAEHPLGASAVTFSPDGRRLAYLAAVPEPGRYGTARDRASAGMGPEAAGRTDATRATEATEATASAGGAEQTEGPGPAEPAAKDLDGPEKPGADAELPRRITQMSYRVDGKGFFTDKPEQIFVLELAEDAKPRQITNEPDGASRPAFTPDGARLVYTRRFAPDSLREDLVIINADLAQAGTGDVIVSAQGEVYLPIVVGEEVVYLGTAFEGTDFAGRCPGLWAVGLQGGEPRRLTDPVTVQVDGLPGDPVAVGGAVLVGVQDRGSVGVRAIPISGSETPLADLPVVLGGERVVKAFSVSASVSGSRLAATVATPSSTGDLITITLGADGLPAGDEVALTDVSGPLRTAGIARQVEISGSAPDGYPVHGWLVVPEGPGPHPVLLAVHGGPHTQYGWGIFDEAQIYAGRGYAVVLGNPRGSSGYGEAHGRAIVGALGTVDVDDLLSLLDVALARPECDAERVGVMGGSYGGFMTSWLAAHAHGRFVAAISERAVNAWDSFTGSSDIGYFFSEGYTGPDRDTQWKASPLAYADQIDIPFLIVHSEQDWRCPIEQAQRMFVALKSRGHEVEMLVFPGEGHELSRSGKPQHRRRRFEAILDWWDRHLPMAQPNGQA